MKQILSLIFCFLFVLAANAKETVRQNLPPCKSTPNCVSSQAVDKKHYIEPFKINGEAKVAWEKFRKAIVERDRVMITHETETTLHAEATSLVLQFVDDIDAVLDEKAGVIHIRSASRVGHTDFGVNRKRIEAFRDGLRKLHVVAKLPSTESYARLD